MKIATLPRIRRIYRLIDSSPELKCIETVARKHLAGQIAAFIEINAKPYTRCGRRG